MLKKILSVALSAFLIFAVPVSLSSCGSSKSSNTYKPGTKEYDNAMWMGRHGYFDNK